MLVVVLPKTHLITFLAVEPVPWPTVSWARSRWTRPLRSERWGGTVELAFISPRCSGASYYWCCRASAVPVPSVLPHVPCPYAPCSTTLHTFGQALNHNIVRSINEAADAWGLQCLRCEHSTK